MSEFVIMVGLPGSGKTTYANEHYPAYRIISSDAIVEKIAKDLNKKYDDIWEKYIGMADKQFFEELNDAVASGHNIVVDRTNLSRRSRARIIAPLISNKRVADYNVVAILMDPQLDTIRERLGARKDKTIAPGVIHSMRNLFEVPDETVELINEVIEVDDKT